MDKHLTQLDNGLKTLFINSPGSPSGTVQVWFRAGSVVEDKEDFGVAHFLEHMFFKGTKTRPGANIAMEVESFGGEINAFTSFDYTCYYINTPSNKIHQTCDILLDMVSNPEFRMEDLVPERGVVFEEYRRSIDSPTQFLFQNLQKNCFTKGYKHPILGTEKHIKNFTREQLIRFRKKFYNSSNALLVVAGDLKNQKNIEKKINQFKLPKGPSTVFPNFKLANKAKIDVHHKDIETMNLYLTIEAPPFDKKESAIEDLALNCLGHGESSILFKYLVLDGTLANNCSCSTMFMSNGGAHFIKASFPYENLNKVLTKLNQVLTKVYKEGFDHFDLKKIKNQYLASKIYEKESIEAFAFSLGHGFAQNGDINCEEVFLSRIKDVNIEEVNKSIRNILSRPIHLTCQIPNNGKLESVKTKLEQFNRKLENISNTKLRNNTNKNNIGKSKYDPQVEHIPIAPGVSLIYRQNPMTPTFVMQAYLKGGLTEETHKNNGIYHLTGSLLAKGHKNKPYAELRQTLEENSANLSGFSGRNAYGLILHGLSHQTDELFNEFFQSLIDPSFDEELFNHDQMITLRQLLDQEKDPVKTCFKEVGKVVFGNHPYALNVIGTPSSHANISLDDIRNLHQENLKAKSLLFTYCGDLSRFEIEDKVRRHILDIKRSFKNIKRQHQVKPHLKNISIEMDREQTHIFIGMPSVPLADDRNLLLKIITTHLSGQSSELFVDVRDKKGLCYTAQPIHFSALEGGFWGIYMASGHDKVEAATEAIRNILGKIKTKGLKKAQFNRVKKMIEGQNLINIQTNDDYANLYSINCLHGLGLDEFHNNQKKIKEMDYENFQQGVKKLFNNEMFEVIVGKK